MNLINGTIIFAAIILGSILTMTGFGLVIFNIINPKGLMLEGIMATSIGILMLLMVIVANSVGQAVLIFSNVFQKQVEMQEQIQNKALRHINPNDNLLDNIFGDLEVHNIGSVDTTGKTPEEISSLISDMLKAGSDKSLDKSQPKKNRIESKISQLENQLAQALADENYEEAKKIEVQIKELREKK